MSFQPFPIPFCFFFQLTLRATVHPLVLSSFGYFSPFFRSLLFPPWRRLRFLDCNMSYIPGPLWLVACLFDLLRALISVTVPPGKFSWVAPNPIGTPPPMFLIYYFLPHVILRTPPPLCTRFGGQTYLTMAHPCSFNFRIFFYPTPFVLSNFSPPFSRIVAGGMKHPPLISSVCDTATRFMFVKVFSVFQLPAFEFLVNCSPFPDARVLFFRVWVWTF